MSLRDLAAAHAQTILDGETPVTLTVSGVAHALHGLVNAVGTYIDANGMTVPGDHKTVSISTLALAAAGIADPYSLKSTGGTVDTTDVNGKAIHGTISLPVVDATVGIVTLHIKEDD